MFSFTKWLLSSLCSTDRGPYGALDNSELVLNPLVQFYYRVRNIGGEREGRESSAGVNWTHAYKNTRQLNLHPVMSTPTPMCACIFTFILAHSHTQTHTLSHTEGTAVTGVHFKLHLKLFHIWKHVFRDRSELMSLQRKLHLRMSDPLLSWYVTFEPLCPSRRQM